MNLILCGFKHTGKTYFGIRLAARLQLPFLDTDQLIEQQEGTTCAAIVRARGEGAFRSLEEKIVLSLSPQDSIIALGGGTPLNPALLPHLTRLGALVFLVQDLEVLKERFRTLKKPSFLDTMTFEEMVAERLPLYERLPAQKVILAKKTDEEVLKELELLYNSFRCLKK